MKIKRIYEKTEKSDGYRILVDRLWPRGVAKARAKVDLWMKDIAPSTALRTWFGHDPKKWMEFKKKYKAELVKNKEAVAELKKTIRKEKHVTLLYGAKDTEHTHALVLLDVLKKS